jgi:hypothetical protein
LKLISKGNITDLAGGEEFLRWIGFQEKMLSVPTKELYWVLPEPNVEADLEAWSFWYSRITQIRDQLASRL